MGKATRKRQAELDAQNQTIQASLAAKSGERVVRESKIVVPAHFLRYKHQQIRNYEDWCYTKKSKDVSKAQLELARHLFAKYPVPKYLEQTFLDPEDKTYKSWYLSVAQGKSLYKTCTKGILTKQETHYFLKAPNSLNVVQAIWWAKTMSLCGDIGVSFKIAQSPLTRFSYADQFWNEVLRFFVVNSVSLKEMEELIDYIRTIHTENPSWSIKKRSLDSIRRASEKWHRDLAKLKQIGGGIWEGMGIPVWTFTTGKYDPNPSENTETIWKIEEITTGDALAREGNEMRHCVLSYKESCKRGHTSIFTMRSDTVLKSNRRHLTIEVTRATKAIVQARGLANRLPRNDESTILQKWAKDNQLTIRCLL